jgi:cob(I)alamin adenosyltransferase
MTLYTRTGDDGTTGLFGGDRVGKDHARIEAFGAVDELNASLGLAIVAVDAGSGPFAGRLLAILTALQSRLFDLGADLATPAGARHERKVPRIRAEHVTESERWIDEIDSGNAPMRQFVLPGGSELAARLHLARTIARRAERRMVHLGREAEINPQAMILMNRLSDLLFAMARRANREAGLPDVPWVPGGSSAP